MKAYPYYRESDIEWTGRIPSHWRTGKLKYFSRINPTKNLDSILKESNDLVVFLPMEKVNENGTYDASIRRPIKELWSGFTYFAEQDVIVAKITPCFENGKGALIQSMIGHIGFGSTEFHVIRALPDISFPGFLYYLSQSHLFKTTGEAFMFGAAGQKRVPTSFVTNFPFNCPPYSEQQAITDFLDRKTAQIDWLVEKKKRQIELLQEQRTALINQAVTKGLNPDVPMKDSGIEWLGEIPSHWALKRIKHLVKRKKYAIKTGPFGSQLTNSDMARTDVKVYNQRSVIDNDFISGENYVSLEKFLQLKEFEIFAGDVLITTRGTIGRCAIFPDDAEKGILHPCLIRLQLDEELMLKEYLISFIQDSVLFQESIFFESNATTIEVIYSSTLKQVIVPVPPVIEQSKIIDYLLEVNIKIEKTKGKLAKEIELLQEYRTALISAAVTGKIDVRSS
jgi:restriction endonuclease S subunit